MKRLLPAGTLLQHRYQVERLLGQGGMGAVYLAHDLRLDKLCAVKETLDVSPEAQQQFKREALLLAHLDHPHLPRVTDYFAQTERYYLVMDYIDGPDLDAWGRDHGPASTRQALVWGDQVLDALQCLHGQSPPVIHRDVKPANIKLTSASRQGVGGKAVLVDFGIAKEFIGGQHTVTGARACSPGFAPLEQYAARGQTDARTDIYGLGATLYFLLTGVPPADALDRAAGQRLPRPQEANPDVQLPASVDTAVMKALALQKQDRWQSAAEMRQALAWAGVQRRELSPRIPARMLEHTRHPQSQPVPERQKPSERAQESDAATWLRALGVVAAALVVLLLLLGLWLVQTNGTGTPVAATEASLGFVVPRQATSTLAPVRTVVAVARVSSTASARPTAARPSPSVSLPTVTHPAATTTRAPANTATAAPTGAQAGPTVTRSAVAQPTPFPAPILLQPERTALLHGKPRFTWRWTHPPLTGNAFFDLRIWSQQEESANATPRGAIEPTKATEAEVDLKLVPAIQQYGEGDYYWTVVVVQDRQNPKIVGEWGEERMFHYGGPEEDSGPKLPFPSPQPTFNPPPPPPDVSPP